MAPKIRTHFATSIYQAPLKLTAKLRSALLKEAYQFKKLDDQGRKWSLKNYFNGYTSYGSLSELHKQSPNFAALEQKIDHAVAAYAKALGFDLQGGRLKMVSLWINIMGKGAHHSWHLHPLSAISGTYYLEVPKGSGGFKIQDPRLGLMMAAPPKRKGAPSPFVELTPRKDEVILFESWLNHEVPVNPVEQERISLSFNYDWV